MTDFRACVLVPTYDNPTTIRSVVERAHALVPDVIVVDDGSGPDGRDAVEALGRDGLAEVVRRDDNGGKGAAVKTGLARARELAFTHAVQVDADGQHALEDIPKLLDAAREQPDALVLGTPVFDRSASRGRLFARSITTFWCAVETGGRVIEDPMCGFRVYPIDAALAAGAKGDAMDFDPEIAVRLVWNGVPVVHVETAVRYIPREQGGVSHFRMVKDNALISWMHTRLCVLAILRWAKGAGAPAASTRRLPR